MAEKWSLLLLTLVASDLVSSQINHQSVHDQVRVGKVCTDTRISECCIISFRILCCCGAAKGESLLSHCSCLSAFGA